MSSGAEGARLSALADNLPWRTDRDRNLELLANYLVNDLPVDQMVEIDANLTSDAELRELAELLTRTWFRPVRDIDAIPAASPLQRDAECAAEWQRVIALAQEPTLAKDPSTPRKRRLRAVFVLAWLLIPLGAAVYAYYQRFGTGMDREMQNSFEGRALTGGIRDPKVIETGAEAQTFALPDGSRLPLQPLGRFTHSAAERETMFGALDGDAVLEVPAGKTWMLNLNGGPIFVTAGKVPARYSIRSPINSKQSWISILQGTATVVGTGVTNKTFVTGQTMYLTAEPMALRALEPDQIPAGLR